MSLRFDNRIAVITGAGGGLGRAYALLLSSLGAKVVVNDFARTLAGQAHHVSSHPADAVVKEIQARGGEALASHDSVEDGERIVATAISAYGRIDILINNAGILRDKSFMKMTAEDFDAVVAVHLRGCFSCTKAAWPYMLKQGYGRVLNCASASGLYGNFGQANYAAAKSALVGFTKSLATEGAKRNVYVNAIAPIAGTRMTASILPKNVVEALRPEMVAPVAAWLCHENSTSNGEIVESGAGWVAAVRWQRTEGKMFGETFGVDDVAKNWKTISDFSKDVSYPSSLQDSLMVMTQSLDTAAEAEKPAATSPTEKPAATSPTEKPAATSPTEKPAATSKADKLFSLLGAYLAHNGGKEGEKLCKKLGAKYFWDILEKRNGPVKTTWSIDLRNGFGSCRPGKEGDADATFIIPEDDLISILIGKLNPQVAFLQGKMKIKGSMKKASSFTPKLFPKIDQKLLNMSVEDAIKSYLTTQNPQSKL